MKSGNLSLLETSGPVQACNGNTFTEVAYFKKQTRVEYVFAKKHVRLKSCLNAEPHLNLSRFFILGRHV
jgi:hypothetical protein